MLLQITSVAASATPADALRCELKTWKLLLVGAFKLPNFKARGELALGLWWHINPHTAYEKQMVQGYFLTRDHFYICDCKFAHGPTEMDAWSYGK